MAIKIENLQYLQIGVQGENAATSIEFDMTSWVEQFPQAAFHLLFKPYNSLDIFPMVTEYNAETHIMTWTPTLPATATPGVGYAEIRAMYDEAGMLKKSRIVPTSVENSVSGVDGGTVPLPYEDWVNLTLSYKTGAETAADNAEAYSLDAYAYKEAALNAKDTAVAARDTAVAAKDDAVAAKNTAVGAKDDAVSAKNTAVSAKEDAVDAKDDAVAAKEDAEDAKDAAVAAKETAESEANDAIQASNDASDSKNDCITLANSVGEMHDETESFMNTASAAKDDAVSAKNDAVTAKDAAVTAKNDAVSAKNDAVTAKTAAQTAQSNAETAKDSAVSAKNDAVTAKDNAVAAKDLAVQAKDDAVTAKNAAEAAAAAATSIIDDTAGLGDTTKTWSADKLADMFRVVDTETEDGFYVKIGDSITGYPINEIKLKLRPKQNFNGYSYPWAGGKDKNICPPQYTQAGKWINNAGTVYTNYSANDVISPFIRVEPNTYYYFSGKNLGSQSMNTPATITFWKSMDSSFSHSNYIGGANGTITGQTGTAVKTASGYEQIYAVISYNKSNASELMLEQNNVKTSYRPYANICAITGMTSVKLQQLKNLTQTELKTITFPNGAGTVYGGYVLVHEDGSAELVSDMAYISSYAGETLPGEWCSDRNQYVAGTTPTNGAAVAYVVESPTTYQFDPGEIIMPAEYSGEVWLNTNAGKSSCPMSDKQSGIEYVKYYTDLKRFVIKKLQET